MKWEYRVFVECEEGVAKDVAGSAWRVLVGGGVWSGRRRVDVYYVGGGEKVGLKVRGGVMCGTGIEAKYSVRKSEIGAELLKKEVGLDVSGLEAFLKKKEAHSDVIDAAIHAAIAKKGVAVEKQVRKLALPHKLTIDVAVVKAEGKEFVSVSVEGKDLTHVETKAADVLAWANKQEAGKSVVESYAGFVQRIAKPSTTTTDGGGEGEGGGGGGGGGGEE